mmetsp:Transcript_19305/g.57191  ORF Transcript_19305/g.57191 Transcript_19305/m.57191 type:complete len:425 (+) Transcript_19305:35-1309(+)
MCPTLLLLHTTFAISFPAAAGLTAPKPLATGPATGSQPQAAIGRGGLGRDVLTAPSTQATGMAGDVLRAPSTPARPLLLIGGAGAIALALLVAPPAFGSVDTTAVAAAASEAAPAYGDVWEKAAKRALGGGVSGALASVAQVLTLMWLRTVMNYQYASAESISTSEALRRVYAEGGGTLGGGVRRLYRGLPFALLQTPLTRFGDTAANTGVLLLLADPSVFGGATAALPVAVRTAIASGAASVWRIGLTPVDTLKSTLQVRGEEAYDLLLAKFRAEGAGVLFQGALASAAASFVGSYPWFLTYNALDERLPASPEGEVALRLCRSALLGVAASCVSDCTSNSLRVLKTRRQTAANSTSYLDAAREIVDEDGWAALFVRGLGTRLLVNALQAALFTVLWKTIEDVLVNGGGPGWLTFAAAGSPGL